MSKEHRPANLADPENVIDVEPSPPWWRVGMVWLVVGGPLLAVVASVGTAVVAVRGADIVLTDLPAAMQPGHTAPTAATPAHEARNHAATAARP
jgi:uncharacterized protein